MFSKGNVWLILLIVLSFSSTALALDPTVGDIDFTKIGKKDIIEKVKEGAFTKITVKYPNSEIKIVQILSSKQIEGTIDLDRVRYLKNDILYVWEWNAKINKYLQGHRSANEIKRITDELESFLSK